MAWVGEATGIIKAQDAEKVAGIIRIRGSIPMLTLAWARMGRTTLVVAVLEVISVRKVRITQTRITSMTGGSPSKAAKEEPTMSERPLELNPPAMAKPPPNRSRMPQGNFLAVCQVIRE